MRYIRLTHQFPAAFCTQGATRLYRIADNLNSGTEHRNDLPAMRLEQYPALAPPRLHRRRPGGFVPSSVSLTPLPSSFLPVFEADRPRFYVGSFLARTIHTS